MSTPKNIQRDAIYMDPAATRLGLATEVLVSFDLVNGNSDGSVHTDFAFAQYNYLAPVTVSALSAASFGILIAQPIGDRQPYRVKAYGRVTNENEALAIVVGYAPLAPSGTNDEINKPAYFPFNGEFDELITVDARADGETYFGRPLYFGIVAFGALAALRLFADISVQNLGVKPPTMQNAVS